MMIERVRTGSRLLRTSEYRQEICMFTNTKRSVGNSEGAFPEWQKLDRGTPLAPYNITEADHPSYGSAVSENVPPECNLSMSHVPFLKRGSSSSVPY